MRISSSTVLSAGWLVFALHSLVAWADTPTETRLREALRAATAQVQALEDERASWHVKEAALQKELEALRKQPVAKVNCGSTTSLSRQLDEQTTALAKLMASLTECQANAQKAIPGDAGARSCAAQDEAVTRLTNEVSSLNSRLTASEARNAKLFQAGMDVIHWALNLKQIDLGGDLVEAKRVEMENTAQDFEDKLVSQKSHP